MADPGVYSQPGRYSDPSLPYDRFEHLYDRESDPYLTENRITERPEVVAELRCVLDERTSDALDTPDAIGLNPLVRMVRTDGPYNYNDPRNFAEAYRETGAERQVEAVLLGGDFGGERHFIEPL